jgi:hypothetical protein
MTREKANTCKLDTASSAAFSRLSGCFWNEKIYVLGKYYAMTRKTNK